MSEYLYFVLNMLFSFLIHVKGASECYQIVASAAISHWVRLSLPDLLLYAVYDSNYSMTFSYTLWFRNRIDHNYRRKKCQFVFPHKYIRNGLNHRRINKWPTNVNIDFFYRWGFHNFCISQAGLGRCWVLWYGNRRPSSQLIDKAGHSITSWALCITG